MKIYVDDADDPISILNEVNQMVKQNDILI